MPADPARPSTLVVSGSLLREDERARRQGTRVGQRRPRWRRRVAIASSLIVAGLLVAFGWSEFYPKALTLADAAYRRNDLETTIRIAKGHLMSRPFSRHAALLVARCFSRLSRPDDAEPYYQRAGSLNLEDRHIRAYALVVNNRREPAIQAYREILASWPNEVLALSRMAAVLISESRWPETLDAAKRLIQIPTATVIGHTLAGVVYHNTFNSDLAVIEYDRVLELDPDLKRMPLKPRSMFWIQYGHELLAAGRSGDARRCLERALGEGDDAKIADLLGQSYYLEAAFDDAERCWRQSIFLDQARFGTWWRLGKLELQRGRPKEAIEPLRRAIALQPKAVGPLYALSLAYRGVGQTAESDRIKEEINRLRAKATTSPGGKVAEDVPRDD
jgi:tetratricopeptide (TPR) repeat protein